MKSLNLPYEVLLFYLSVNIESLNTSIELHISESLRGTKTDTEKDSMLMGK